LTKFQQHYTLVSKVHKMKVIIYDHNQVASGEQHQMVSIKI